MRLLDWKQFYALIGEIVSSIEGSREIEGIANNDWKYSIEVNNIEMNLLFEDIMHIDFVSDDDYWVSANSIYLLMDEPNSFMMMVGNLCCSGNYEEIKNAIVKLHFSL